ncbi:hypothetical protein QTG56_23060 (plasmid) [Rossellomorea sp. AcN35-11]|nr:hypothetical protein [Rossellomorea aquimaris]WJV32246.1 hypothetical protein QTG56_23060 [Rossellomorea sp. AcN35-11]
MKLRIKGRLYDLSSKTLEEQRTFLRKWYAKGEKNIECLCVNGRDKHPIMHIRKTVSKNKQIKYSLVNNRKGDSFHHYSCPNNSKQRKYLKNKGITYHDGILKLSYIKENSSNQWHSFFLGLLSLEECGIATYKHGQTRNISSRIYKAASICEVDGRRLLDKNTFDIQVIKKGKKKVVIRNTHESPRLIIGWGSSDVDYIEHHQYDFLGKLPLYSVDDTSDFVCNITMKKSLLEGVKKDINGGNSQGWWLIWRDINKKGVLEVRDLLFIPADPGTRIPIESRYDELLIEELVKLKKNFSKPLLWKINVSGVELSPNIIIVQDSKNTVVEIARNVEEFYHLNKIETIYKSQGFKFIEWRAFDEKHKLSGLSFND